MFRYAGENLNPDLFQYDVKMKKPWAVQVIKEVADKGKSSWIEKII
jgi:hypothetical protein